MLGFLAFRRRASRHRELSWLSWRGSAIRAALPPHLQAVEGRPERKLIGPEGPRVQHRMAADTEKTALDPGLACLVILLRIHGIAAEVEQIRHRLGSRPVRISEMIRCGKQLGLKARASRTNWARLTKTPLPGIAALRDGGFIILGKISENKILVQGPSSPRPELMTRAEFEA